MGDQFEDYISLNKWTNARFKKACFPSTAPKSPECLGHVKSVPIPLSKPNVVFLIYFQYPRNAVSSIQRTLNRM